MTQSTELLRFLEEYVTFFQRMVLTEEEKLEGLLKNDLAKIEGSIITKQSEQMGLQNLEKRRMELQNKLGWGEISLLDIITSLQEPEKTEMEQKYDQLNKAIDQVKFLNEKSMDIVRMNMSLQEALAGQSPLDTGGIYSKDTGKQGAQTSNLLQKDI